MPCTNAACWLIQATRSGTSPRSTRANPLDLFERPSGVQCSAFDLKCRYWPVWSSGLTMAYFGFCLAHYLDLAHQDFYFFKPMELGEQCMCQMNLVCAQFDEFPKMHKNNKTPNQV